MVVLGATTALASLGFSTAIDRSGTTLSTNLPSFMLPGSSLSSSPLAIKWGLKVGPMPKVRGRPLSPINPCFPLLISLDVVNKILYFR